MSQHEGSKKHWFNTDNAIYEPIPTTRVRWNQLIIENAMKHFHSIEFDHFHHNTNFDTFQLFSEQ